MIPRGALFAVVVAGAGAAAGAAVDGGGGGGGAEPSPPRSPSPSMARGVATKLPPPRSFEAGATEGTDLVLLPPPDASAARPTVMAATRVAVGGEAVGDVLLRPERMRQALPALVRADVVATRAGPRPNAWPDRLLAWEVEIPLFNLSGQAWLHQHDDGVELMLTDGAFAPGHVRFRWAPPATGPGALVTCEVQLEARSGNWLFRRVANHDRWSEAAISGAAAWLLLRAAAQRAETPAGAPTPRAVEPIAAPAAHRLNSAAVTQPALAHLRAAGTLAAVTRARGGRLAWASVAVDVRGSPAQAAARLMQPETWRVFPGWKSVTRRARDLRGASPAPGATILIDVDDNIPFVDFEAAWAVTETMPVRATAIEGDTRGAVFAWDVRAGDRSGFCLGALSMHPRLDAAGFIERKMIAAEPLLEHALAVALAYVDAAAVADSLPH